MLSKSELSGARGVNVLARNWINVLSRSGVSVLSVVHCAHGGHGNKLSIAHGRHINDYRGDDFVVGHFTESRNVEEQVSQDAEEERTDPVSPHQLVVGVESIVVVYVNYCLPLNEEPS